MPSITLADIQAAADKKYGPLVIELPDGPVTLVNPLRMNKAARDKLTKLDDIEDPEEKLQTAIRIGAKAADAKRLLAAVTDLATLAEIVTQWTSSAQVGEASPSPS
jgi:hypothetical protein